MPEDSTTTRRILTNPGRRFVMGRPLNRGVVPAHEFVAPGTTDLKADVSPSTRLIYSPPGLIIESVEVVTIYWGATWGSGPDAILSGQLDAFFDFILTSSLMDMLSEYNSPTTQIKHGKRKKPSVRITIREPGTPQTGGGRTITDNEVQQALKDFIAHNTIPKPDANTLYFIYLPPNVTCIDQEGKRSCAGSSGICGYHGSDRSGPDPTSGTRSFPISAARTAWSPGPGPSLRHSLL
jgi:hypothetical protein